jgi:tripeptide aminopeptidase
MKNLDFFKQLLSVPSKTYKEDMMVEFLTNYLTENNYDFFLDEHKNIYVKKTSPEFEGQLFPAVVAHTDTVHEIDSINVREEMLPNGEMEDRLSLKAYNNDGHPTGIGGDDKCGIFGALECLNDLPHIKIALFVSEETGCWGSRYASDEFFSDVAYAIQLDAPEDYMVTEVCSGIRLFDRETHFFDVIDGVFRENLSFYEYKIHPYTDVSMLKKKFDFSCVNISCGYYNYHTRNEYVVLEDLERAINMSKQIIDKLGYEKQEYVYQPPNYSRNFYDY